MRFMPVFLLFIGLFNSTNSQSINYREVFGNDWIKASEFETGNRIWIKQFLDSNNISYPEAIAVVFPELVRYSALRDKMETSLLKTLYINLGETYANFSIGIFQMKPSFAILIREESPSEPGKEDEIYFRKSITFSDIRDFREEIISDLEKPVQQLKYLAAFMKICEKVFNVSRMNESERVRFLATAYNFGIDKDRKGIENMTGKKFFNTKLFSTENYSYADVSLYWYNQNKSVK